MAGLASAVWALHEFISSDGKLSLKGLHRGLRNDNILVDGTRFILAGFGSSSLKQMDESTETSFECGLGPSCRAPECGSWSLPGKHTVTQASDIFTLACVFTDIVVHFVKGPQGVQEFENAREFTLGPLRYFPYHKGASPNDAVAETLQEIIKIDGSAAMWNLGKCLHSMLEIRPSERPSAADVTAHLYICTVEAFADRVVSLLQQFDDITDAHTERERFESWRLSHNLDLYRRSSSATTTSRFFHSIVEILRQLELNLDELASSQFVVDSRSFLGIRDLHTQGTDSRSRLHSLTPEDLLSQQTAAESSPTLSSDRNMIHAGADHFSWENILNTIRVNFVQQNCELPTVLLDERSLCEQFGVLCNERDEHDYETLFTKIRYHQIDSFAYDVDQLLGHSVSNRLSTVAPAGNFVAIKV